MKYFFPLSLIVFVCLSPSFGQDSDEIVLTAVFNEAIDIEITAGNNITFTVGTISEYNQGISSPFNYFTDFSVTASVDFQVSMSATDFVSQNGDSLDMNNFGYTIMDRGTYEAGVRHKLLGQSTSPSALTVLDNTATTLIQSWGPGNAGTAESNSFRLHFELGTPALRSITSLPSLLEQKITPGTYVSTLTLTATATP